MKQKSPTASGRKAARDKISTTAFEALMREARARTGLDTAKIMSGLIALDYRDSEFCTGIDSVATTKPETLPVELTLPTDVWIMIARIARHKNWTYGQVVTACLDEDLAMLCRLDDEAREALTEESR